MKRILSVVLSLIVLTSLLNFNAFAANDDTAQNEIVISETTEYFDDGSSIVTTITQYVNQDHSRATRTVSGSKTRTV